jgi:inner membrane protein
MMIISLSILPDLDSVAGLLMGDLGRYHNNWTHSFIVGLGVALLVGCLAWLLRHSGFSRWFILALLCYESHIIMDYLTIGRGIMAFWPFSSERFVSPVPVFYGLHWSDGWLSLRHLLTLVTEVGFVALTGFIVYLYLNRKGHIPKSTGD